MEICDRCTNLMESASLENYQGEVEQCNGCGMIRIYIKKKEPKVTRDKALEDEIINNIYQAFKGAPKFARGGWVYKDANL